MCKPETIRINDIEYVRADSVQSAVDGEVTIVVLQRGWVAVGYLTTDPDDKDQRILAKAKIIRVWGTTKGLGEIAVGGPTAKTVLDPATTMRFHALTIVTTIDCDGAKWQLVL